MSSIEPQRPDLRYLDDPELRETFAESISQWYFDGHLLRIELAVSRLDAPQPSSGRATGRQHPVCRLVLAPNAILELLNRCQQTGAALEKMGVVAKAGQGTAASTAR